LAHQHDRNVVPDGIGLAARGADDPGLLEEKVALARGADQDGLEVVVDHRRASRTDARLAGYRSSVWRNHSIACRSPSSTSTRGSQPRSVRARVMSGCRILGSSTGSAWKTMGLALPARRMTRFASSRSVISCGFPRLTGSWTSDCIRRQMPSTRSDTYW